MRVAFRCIVSGFMGAVCLVPCLRAEARDAGDVVVAANIGVPLYTHNFDTGKDTTIHDRLSISELLGAHYFVTKAVRVGMMVQWTEQYTGALARGSDRFSTFALLPQVGWNFYDHFSVAAIFTYAPRASGQNRMDLGVQALFGYGLPITKSATLNLIAEVPYNFHLARTIGVSPLAGLTMDL